jgi:two-component system sensor kinase FixL
LAGDIIKQMRGYVQKGDAERESVDLEQLVRDTLTLGQAEVKDSPIKIELDVEQPLPSVNVNVIQIQQVILNLMRNANEAIKQTGEDGRISIEIRHLTPTKLKLSIEDTGPGIPDDLLDRLFDPFVSSKQEGIGIGLSICKSIIESHGGSISAFNQIHAGACIRISLPVSTSRIPEHDQ